MIIWTKRTYYLQRTTKMMALLLTQNFGSAFPLRKIQWANPKKYIRPRTKWWGCLDLNNLRNTFLRQLAIKIDLFFHPSLERYSDFVKQEVCSNQLRACKWCYYYIIQCFVGCRWQYNNLISILHDKVLFSFFIYTYLWYIYNDFLLSYVS